MQLPSPLVHVSVDLILQCRSTLSDSCTGTGGWDFLREVGLLTGPIPILGRVLALPRGASSLWEESLGLPPTPFQACNLSQDVEGPVAPARFRPEEWHEGCEMGKVDKKTMMPLQYQNPPDPRDCQKAPHDGVGPAQE